MIMFWGIIWAWIVTRRDIRAGNAQTKSSSPMRIKCKICSDRSLPTADCTQNKKSTKNLATTNIEDEVSKLLHDLNVVRSKAYEYAGTTSQPHTYHPPRTSSCSLTAPAIATTRKRWRTSSTRRTSSGRLNWCRSLNRISRSRKRRTGCTRTRRGGACITRMGLTWGLGSCTRRWGRARLRWFIRLSRRVMYRFFCRRWRMIMVDWRWGISGERRQGAHYLEYTKDHTANPPNDNSNNTKA